MQYYSHQLVVIKSDRSGRTYQIKRITNFMQSNGYPRKLTEKATRRQMKRGMISLLKETDYRNVRTARTPFINGVSQEVQILASAAGVRCAFFMPDTLRHAYES